MSTTYTSNDRSPAAANGQTPVEVLEIALFQAVNGLRSAARTRQSHPTYGVTKADLRERLAHVEGIAHALDAVEQGYNSASIKLAADRVLRDHLNIEMRGLVALVEEA
jgi:hypothetical protein